MRLIKCDRCGCEIPKEQDYVGFIGVMLKDAKTGELFEDNPFEDWDICDDCLREIDTFINKPKVKQEKFEKILDSVDAGKKAPTEKKKYVPKFDVGKAQALRDRGWSIVKIAQEMKVSEPTIIKWTHPAPEPKKPKPLEWAEHEPDLNPVIQATAEAKPFKTPETEG